MKTTILKHLEFRFSLRTHFGYFRWVDSKVHLIKIDGMASLIHLN